jgi:hypothetical protein
MACAGRQYVLTMNQNLSPKVVPSGRFTLKEAWY